MLIINIKSLALKPFQRKERTTEMGCSCFKPASDSTEKGPLSTNKSIHLLHDCNLNLQITTVRNTDVMIKSRSLT